MRLLRLAIVSCFLVGCGGAAAPSSGGRPEAPPPPPPQPSAEATATLDAPAGAAAAPRAAATGGAAEAALEVAPIRVISTEAPTQGQVMLELGADGTLTGKEGAIGKVEGSSIVVGTTQFFTVDRDGTVEFKLAPGLKMHFDEDDALIIETPKGQGKLVVDGTGHATISREGKSETLPIRIEGATRSTRRVSALLAFSSTVRKKGR